VAYKVIIGGGMAYTFLKAQGYEVGTSICELEKVPLAKSLLEQAQGKIVLPIDFAFTEKFENEPAKKVGPITDILPNEMSLDIGPKSIELFASVLATAKTVVWNGPMGVFEMSNYAKGTIGVCDAISKLQDAITIVGGGDSAAAAIQFGYASKFTHISTGGGASLEYLEGKLLPGVEIVANK